MLLSQNLLEAMPFNYMQTSAGWEGSSIRSWLNGTFYNDAFSAEEKGFHTKDLTLFCELTNLIPLLSDEELDRATCRDLINEKRGYSTKYDDDSFVPVETEDAENWLKNRTETKINVCFEDGKIPSIISQGGETFS